MTVRRMASAYEFADRLIVMADHRTDAGFWRAGEPVIRLPRSADDDALGKALLRAVAEAPLLTPATHWKEYAGVRAALAKAAGFGSWAPFDKNARMCSFRESMASAHSIMPMRHGGTRGPDKGFHECPELEIAIASGASPADVGAAIRRGLALSQLPSAAESGHSKPGSAPGF